MKKISVLNAIFAAVFFGAAFSSCSKMFSEETVEKSRREVTVTLTFVATNGGQWEADGTAERKVSGIKGTKFPDMDNPSLYGSKFAGWTPAFEDVFPQEDTTYYTVWDEDVLSLTLEKKRLGLEAGESEMLAPESVMYIEDAKPTLTWTSSDESVAAVDQNGNVKAKSDAALWKRATIEAKTINGLSVKCEVMIVEKNSVLERLGAYKILSASEYQSPSGIGNSGTNYVSFGFFPQSVKSESVRIYGEDWEEEDMRGGFITMECGSNTYYLGEDHLWYARAEANPYGDYSFSDGKKIQSQKIYYFKVEPVRWRILDGQKKLLLAEGGLVAGVPYYEGFADRTLGEKKICANNYKYSNARAYLNGTNNAFVEEGGQKSGPDVDWRGRGFLQSAFTQGQRGKIKLTEVDNSFRSHFAESATESEMHDKTEDYHCEDTSDFVFLLSVQEWTKESYGFDKAKGELKRSQSDWALANNARSEKEGTMFRTRSPRAQRQNDATRVSALTGGGGWSDNTSFYIASSFVPALCVK